MIDIHLLLLRDGSNYEPSVISKPCFMAQGACMNFIANTDCASYLVLIRNSVFEIKCSNTKMKHEC